MVFQAVNPFPLWEDLKKYQFSFLRRDMIAALSVALMALPQAMAYAFVANLPISAGIWAVVFGTIFTAAFGQSRFLVSGTTNMVAILIQSGTAEILYTHFGDVSGSDKDILTLNIVLQIVLMVGIFQICAGLLGLGRLTQFISRSVVVGYIVGAALVIVVSQAFPFLGIKHMVGSVSVYDQAWYLLHHIETLHLTTACLSLGCLALLIILFRISEKIPAAALVFIGASGVVFLLNLAPQNAKGVFDVIEGEPVERVTLVRDIAPVSSDLPKFTPPYFEFQLLTKTFPLSFAITLLSVLEATLIGRNYTSSKDPPYNDNQEIYGLGVSNFFSAFLAAMPSSGSFSRSALNKVSDAKTRFASIFSGAFVFLFIFSLGFFINQIPIAALSALMIFTAYTMVNFKQFFICLRATPADGFVVLVTMASSLIFTLDVALYVGVIASVVLYLKRAGIPDLVEYTFNNVGKLRPLESDDERSDPRICIIQAEGELFFGAADRLQTQLRNISEDESIKVVILQLLNTRYIDASVCLALREIYKYLNLTNRKLMISGISVEVWKVLEESGLLEELGKQNCFPANEQLPSEPTRNAYTVARQYMEPT